MTGAAASGLLRAEDVTAEVVAGVGQRVVGVVGEKRSTWRHWNLAAEAARQSMGLRFATVEDRLEVVNRIVREAEQVSLRLTLPARASGCTTAQRLPPGTVS